MTLSLQPLPQHRLMVDWLKAHEPEVWRWQAEAERSRQDPQEVRLSLLRDTYRLDAESHPVLFEELAAAINALGLEEIEVSAYQAQGRIDPNAAICYLPGEAHLIFSGPILTLLSPAELRAILGHELAHYLLWRMDDGDFFIADRMLHQSAAHPDADPSHMRTARLWALATELFADRGAWLAAGCIETAVASLVKCYTGLAQVSGKSYLAQAAEIFSQSKPATEQLSHPEAFIRARALQLWVEQAADLEPAIAAMLDEKEDIENLHLIQQIHITELTHRFLMHHLRPAWFQTEAVLAHARHFFPEFDPAAIQAASRAASREVPDLFQELARPVREFFCQVMLDFCAVDPDLHELPVAAALEQAREMECLEYFVGIAAKPLQLGPRDLKRLKETASRQLAEVSGA